MGSSWAPTPPASEAIWGRGFPSTTSKPHPLLMRMAPSCLHEGLTSCAGKRPFPEWLRDALRDKLASADDAALFGTGEDDMAVLHFLAHQGQLRTCTSTHEENGLRFDAVSGFVKAASDLAKGQHVFAYNMRFTNTGSRRLRVLGRIYDFRDASGSLSTQISAAATESAGVVGYTPLLEPGQSFEFGSGVVLQTPRGSLVGRFLVMEEPDLDGADAKLHERMEEAELTLRFVYYKGLGTDQFHMPLGTLKFDTEVECATLKRSR